MGTAYLTIGLLVIIVALLAFLGLAVWQLRLLNALNDHLSRLAVDRYEEIERLKRELIAEQGAHAWTEARLSGRSGN